MGEVYRARDQRLGRDVAVKALPEEFKRDPDRVARFEREAKLLASLSHPNVGAIYGLEEVGGHAYLVLEYIEGETLAQRLTRGPLPVAEAIEVCREIAAGLEAAHENGVVHRDLKPGNVMLTAAGGVKVLDFGLAKSGDPGTSDSNLSASPTVTYAPTGAGVILGTAVYMSPEQARGKRVDRRTDIWSFGCVLYECLTGKQVFAGETVSDLIAKILEREPDWSPLPAQTPPRVRELLARCLRKNANERLRDIGDARLELTDAESGTFAPAAPSGPQRAGGLPWVLAAALALALVLTIALLLPRTHVPPGDVARLGIDTPRGGVLTGYPGTFEISPDGRSMAFKLSDESGTGRLWLRSLDDVVCRPLEGTEGAAFPFWSPDSRNIAFFSDGKLKRMAATGGAIQVVCDAHNGRGGAWSPRGMIVFAPEPQGPLLKVDASGGVPSVATRLDSTRHEGSHRYPQFLPDGRHFVFGVTPEVQTNLFNTCMASIDDPQGTPLVLSTSTARYVAPGYIVFSRGQALLAQRFDPHALRLHGDPVQLSDVPNSAAPISLSPVTSASADGKLLLYGTAERRPTDFVWVGRDGRLLRTVMQHPVALTQSDLSPSADRLAASEVAVVAKGWVFDLEHGTGAVMPCPDGSIWAPKWAPDGRGAAWLEQVSGVNRIVYFNADGGDQKTLIAEAQGVYREPAAWSRDGRSLLVTQNVPGHQRDLLIGTPGSVATTTWVGSPAMEETPAFSYDGRWVAYASDVSGRREVYVDAFPTPHGAKRVSPSGAGSVAGMAFIAWRKDDREIYYVGTDGRSMLACDVQTGSEVTAGVPRLLFQLPEETWGVAAAPTGDRFLVLRPVGQRPAALTVVQNWSRPLEKGK
jgi:eukaryotic-like serine/threonine-protein kinase